MVSHDDDGLFAEHVIFDCQQIKKQKLETVSFYCRDCLEWGMVHDDEVPDRHKGHDVDAVCSVYNRDGVRVRLWSIGFDVAREET